MKLTAPQILERYTAMRQALRALGECSLEWSLLDRWERRVIRVSIQAQHDLEVRELRRLRRLAE